MSFFSYIYHSDLRFRKNLLIPSVLNFLVPFPKNTIQLLGEYPRRVEQYEILCKSQEFCIRSPLSGIAYIWENKESIKFQIKISGKNELVGFTSNSKKNNLEKLNSLDDFKLFLDSYSLYSFEYENKLSNLFFSKKKVIFSLYDPYIPFFWNEIFKSYKEELNLLLKWFSETFIGYQIEYIPDKLIHNFSTQQRNVFEFHYKYLYHKQKLENFYVFSPTTLYALLRALFNDEPFIKSIFFFRDYDSKKEFLLLLYHGTKFQEVLSNYPYLQNLSFRKKLEINQESYFDIFKNYYYYYKKLKGSKYNFCSACFICNHFCPVNANPMSLVENKKLFKKELCIECGLCEEICEANLPLLEMIQYEFSY